MPHGKYKVAQYSNKGGAMKVDMPGEPAVMKGPKGSSKAGGKKYMSKQYGGGVMSPKKRRM